MFSFVGLGLPKVGMRCVSGDNELGYLVFTVIENFLDCHVEQPRNAEGEWKGRIVLAGLDSVHGLPRDVETAPQFGLAPVTLGAQDLEAVLQCLPPIILIVTVAR